MIVTFAKESYVVRLSLYSRYKAAKISYLSISYGSNIDTFKTLKYKIVIVFCLVVRILEN